ncbi:MAG TPA: indolepyruvate oxidoreductase subunit beta [candidate division Zixibacteria bacterium]|nr:indolepyruvate oxidoreductase subunit beta [candidate division Zixibacteria bacterium]
MTDRKLKVHVTGMGGQGIGSTTRVLATAAKLSDLSVMTMETHGLAQRGGVVVSDLAIGYDPTESPQCADGEADVLIALEALESLRSLPKLKKNGIVVVNTTKYQPLEVRVSKGEVKYPTLEEIEKEIKRFTPNVLLVPAQEDALQLGNSRVMNMILIGALTGNSDILPITKEEIIEGIKAILPPKYIDINLKAFEKGMSYKL